MNAIFLPIIAFVALLVPIHYGVAALPALWAARRALPHADDAIFSAGAVDVTVIDLLLLLLIARSICWAVLQRNLVIDGPIYSAVFVFFLVNLLASFAAGAVFGGEHAMRCIASLARLGVEVAALPMLAQSIRTLPQARRCLGIVLFTLVALAAIQFLNYVGASRGFSIGEVQGVERGELRYFGPVGDSIGFVLLLGYAISLCAASVPGVLAFLGGIFLTAGLGAIAGVGATSGFFLVLGARTAPVRAFFRRNLRLIPVVAVLLCGGLALVAKPLLQRLGQGNYADSGGQRFASARLAGEMILDKPLLGVGFLGYQAALPRYGGDRFLNLSRPDGSTANANNQFLQTLADAGVVGLLATAALLLCALRLFWRVAARCPDPFIAICYRGALIWLLAQICGNLAAVWLIPGSYIARLLWILLGIGIAIQRLPAEEEVLEETAPPRPEFAAA